jgi:hypothetical protein
MKEQMRVWMLCLKFISNIAQEWVLVLTKISTEKWFLP